jgi:hypothetical protein
MISSQLWQGVERILRRRATFWQTTGDKTAFFADFRKDGSRHRESIKQIPGQMRFLIGGGSKTVPQLGSKSTTATPHWMGDQKNINKLICIQCDKASERL